MWDSPLLLEEEEEEVVGREGYLAGALSPSVSREVRIAFFPTIFLHLIKANESSPSFFTSADAS